MEAVRRRARDPGRRLRELGVAYVRFALAHPAQFRIMIADKAAHPALKAAAERAFGLLVSAIADAQRGERSAAATPRR